MQTSCQSALLRVRESAESIAFYGGEAEEMAAVDARMHRVVNSTNALLGTKRSLEFFTKGYRYLIQARTSPCTAASP